MSSRTNERKIIRILKLPFNLLALGTAKYHIRCAWKQAVKLKSIHRQHFHIYNTISHARHHQFEQVAVSLILYKANRQTKYCIRLQMERYSDEGCIAKHKICLYCFCTDIRTAIQEGFAILNSLHSDIILDTNEIYYIWNVVSFFLSVGCETV